MFDFDFERYGPQMEHINYLPTILGLELNPFERGTIRIIYTNDNKFFDRLVFCYWLNKITYLFDNYSRYVLQKAPELFSCPI